MHKLRRLFIVAATIVMAAWGAVLTLAHGNDRGQAKLTIGGAKVTIDYGRPSLKGRNITKMIQPGQLWRIGADAPTTLESDKDLDFGGTRVPKGKHMLLARLVEPGKWRLVFSTKSVFQYDPSAKVAEAPLEFREEKDPVEEVTIRLSNHDGHGVIEIAWGTARLSASFMVAK